MRIILCGFGAVGQSLASLFESRAKELYEMHGLRPRIVGVFDSKGAAFQSSGLDPGKLVSVKKSKGTVGAYGEKTTGGLDMIESVDADVLVETTASNYKDAEPGMSHIMAAMRRGMPKLESCTYSTFSLSITSEKLGQPVPELNFLSDLKRTTLQQTHR